MALAAVEEKKQDSKEPTDPHLKDALGDLLQNTSSHGLPNIYRSVSLKGKLGWGFLVVLAFMMSGSYIYDLTTTYFSYPVAVSLTVKHEKQLVFPAVTLCNVNPIRMSAVLQSGDEELLSMFFPQSAAEDEKEGATGLPFTTEEDKTTEFHSASTVHTATGIYQTTDDGSEEGVEGEEDDGGDDEDWRMVQMYIKEHLLSILMANRTSKSLHALGHQLSDMLLDCSWKGERCSTADFTSFINHKYGNCYTFNSGNSSQPLTVNKPGHMHGLSLELYIEQSEYLNDSTDSAGVIMILHPQGKLPFPEDEGFSLAPGQAVSVGVRQVVISRMPAPHGDCKDEGKLTAEELSSNIYLSRSDMVGYSVQVCERSCYQHRVIGRCGCFDSNYPKPMNLERPINPCNTFSSFDDEDCLDMVDTLFQNGHLKCNCPRACRDKTYRPSVSSLLWPADNYQKTMFRKIVHVNPQFEGREMDSTIVEWARNNMLKVDVYFEDLNYEFIEENAAYKRCRIISDIGGQLGLWLGVSIITICEIAQFVAIAVGVCWRKMKSLRAGRTSTPVKPFSYG